MRGGALRTCPLGSSRALTTHACSSRSRRGVARRTQFELWLSIQVAEADGLRPATSETQRAHLTPIHSATRELAASLLQLWRTKAPQEAHDVLKAPDVRVTNQSDKLIHLPKLLSLNADVREAMAVMASPAGGHGADGSKTASAAVEAAAAAAAQEEVAAADEAMAAVEEADSAEAAEDEAEALMALQVAGPAPTAPRRIGAAAPGFVM
jgi:hypothetical protein